MPEYTAEDRKMLAAEEVLWSVQVLLEGIEGGGEWNDRIANLSAKVSVIARELRDYNGQFETGPDELTATGDQPAAHRGSSS